MDQTVENEFKTVENEDFFLYWIKLKNRSNIIFQVEYI